MATVAALPTKDIDIRDLLTLTTTHLVNSHDSCCFRTTRGTIETLFGLFNYLLQDFGLVRVERYNGKCLMDLVQYSIAFCEGDVLRSHPLPFLGRSAPNNFKEALAPISFLPTSQRRVKCEEFPERSSDLMQNPMHSISALTLKASDPSPNGSSEKERSFAQKKPSTLQRSTSLSPRKGQRAGTLANNQAGKALSVVPLELFRSATRLVRRIFCQLVAKAGHQG